MDKLMDQLQQREQKLQKILSLADKTLQSEVIGNLEVHLACGAFRYSIGEHIKGKHIRKYIKKDNIDTAKKIAQRDYAIVMKKIAEKELKKLSEYRSVYESADINIVHESLRPGRKSLVMPYAITDDEYSKLWLDIQSDYKNTIPIQDDFLTEKGDLVRSKSEMIIADKLYLLNIPYKYEHGIKLGGKIVYPDFTILNPSTREVFIWEHLGMMDNEEYLKKNMEKIRTYERNGYVVGKNLIYSFETSSMPISVQAVNGIINHHFR